MYVLAKLHLYILYTIQYGNTMYQRHYMHVRNNVRITESSRAYNCVDKISNISCSFVTRFAKRGLPHTSDLQVSTIYNFRCVKAMELQIVQFRALTYSVRTGKSFKLVSYLNTELWSFKVRKLDVCGRPLFANLVTFIKKTHVYICTYVTGLVKTRHNSGNLFFT